MQQICLRHGISIAAATSAGAFKAGRLRFITLDPSNPVQKSSLSGFCFGLVKRMKDEKGTVVLVRLTSSSYIPLADLPSASKEGYSWVVRAYEEASKRNWSRLDAQAVEHSPIWRMDWLMEEEL